MKRRRKKRAEGTKAKMKRVSKKRTKRMVKRRDAAA